MNISACGLVCSECEFYNSTCEGCYAVKGSTFWAKDMIPDKICPLYKCAINEKKYKSCGECPELPCRMFREMKDPSLSEEDHQKSLLKRVALLRSN